jgi:hypothetical protein
MPFIMQQQLHMLPAIILHIFCKVAAVISSSHVQVILKPPLHFSNFIVQRGTMHICMAPGIADGIAPAGIAPPIGLIRLLSIIIMLVIPKLLRGVPERLPRMFRAGGRSTVTNRKRSRSTQTGLASGLTSERRPSVN